MLQEENVAIINRKFLPLPTIILRPFPHLPVCCAEARREKEGVTRREEEFREPLGTGTRARVDVRVTPPLAALLWQVKPG